MKYDYEEFLQGEEGRKEIRTLQTLIKKATSQAFLNLEQQGQTPLPVSTFPEYVAATLDHDQHPVPTTEDGYLKSLETLEPHIHPDLYNQIQEYSMNLEPSNQ